MNLKGLVIGRLLISKVMVVTKDQRANIKKEKSECKGAKRGD